MSQKDLKLLKKKKEAKRREEKRREEKRREVSQNHTDTTDS